METGRRGEGVIIPGGAPWILFNYTYSLTNAISYDSRASHIMHHPHGVRKRSVNVNLYYYDGAIGTPSARLRGLIQERDAKCSLRCGRLALSLQRNHHTEAKGHRELCVRWRVVAFT